MTAALVVEDPDVDAVEVAEIMLDSGVKAVAESVPVGLTVLIGAADEVSLGLVVIGAVVEFPSTEGVASGV